MFAQIYGNLHRQFKGLEILETLQKEEYTLLLTGNADGIGAVEFSIHELLRQLAVERDEILKVMQGTKLAEYSQMLPEEEAAKISAITEKIDAMEQRCAKQAERNTTFSLALMDKSQELLQYLYDQVQPKEYPVYGAKGGYTKSGRAQASIFTSRL